MSGLMRESVVTPDVVRLVDGYVDSELSQARKSTNRTPLDESGIFSLHLLAAQVFAKGYELGQSTAEERHHGERMRAHEARNAAE